MTANEFNQLLDAYVDALVKLSPEQRERVQAGVMLRVQDELHSRNPFAMFAAGPTLCRPVGEPVTILVADDYE